MVEIYLFWEGVPGIKDAWPEGYVFHIVDGVRNWQDAVTAVRAELKAVRDE